MPSLFHELRAYLWAGKLPPFTLWFKSPVADYRLTGVRKGWFLLEEHPTDWPDCQQVRRVKMRGHRIVQDLARRQWRGIVVR